MSSLQLGEGEPLFSCNTTFSRVMTFRRPVFGALPDDVINGQNKGRISLCGIVRKRGVSGQAPNREVRKGNEGVLRSPIQL
jgi:hypothetical protein